MANFTGLEMRAIIEEEVSGGDAPGGDSRRLYIGRLAIHAPEIDGAAVIESRRALKLGSFVRVKTVSVAGVDMRCKA
jgi:hypothetical protein